MLKLTMLSLCVVLLAWVVARFWRLRAPLRRLGDPRVDEDGLRAGAEAVLAARLARGEIDDATYARTMQALWGVPPGVPEAAEPGEDAGAAMAEPLAPDINQAPNEDVQVPTGQGTGSTAQELPLAEVAPPAHLLPTTTAQGELPLGDPPPEPYL